MRRIVVATVVFVVASVLTPAVSTDAARAEPGSWTAPADAVAGSYVVTYTPGTTWSAATSDLAAFGIRTTAWFGRAVHGFTATLTQEQRAALARSPRVERIEPNVRLHAVDTQVDPPWGLDRLDQGSATARLDQSYSYEGQAPGASVNVYVLDSGIRASHVEFTGRVQPGRNFIAHTNPSETVPNSDVSDCNGHGTHVSGTIAGTTSGVAKGARIVPVRVLDCSGSGDLSSVLGGIDWVIAHKQQPANAGYDAVANLSLGGGFSQILNDAVAAMTAADIAVAVAAGNDGSDLNGYSPASEPTSITVGAVDSSDVATGWSNWGLGLDVWAPGLSITSAGSGSDTGYVTASGTSMAAPHVAGVLAVLRSAHPADTAYPDPTHTWVRDRLAALTKNVVIRRAGDTSSTVRLVQSPVPTSAVCQPATGFTATAGGALHHLYDPAVLTGSGTLSTTTAAGTGWTTADYVWLGHGGDGVVYLIARNGDLRWYRYDDQTERWLPGSGTRIGTGWNLGSTFDVVEVSRDGTFYAVTSDGALRIYRHQGRLTGSGGWSVWTVGSGWRAPQVIAPNGDGTLYRQYGGTLYWYRHTDPAAGPVSWQGGRVVGTGWTFTDLVPVGGGVLYAVSPTGAVRSYRNTGYATGSATWDAIRSKGAVPMALGTVLDPYTCTS